MIKKVRWSAVAVVVAVLLLIVWQSHWLALGWYWVSMQRNAAEWSQNGIWLPYYHATLERHAIAGIDNNASGLTFSKHSGTLFAVINSPPAVVELSPDGELLRRIPLDGAADTEGISHIADDLFVIADERRHQLHFVRIGADTARVDVRAAPTLGLAIDLTRNLGFEGVSWDAAHQRLYVSKEKSPMRVLTVDGVPALLEGARPNLQIAEWKPPHARTLFMTDLSSLSVHERTGNLLLLSDESSVIVEYAPDGRPVSLLPMWRGLHGLSRTVPQAEGIAMGPDGTLYVLSEPNLFYRFERRQPAPWAAAGRG